MSTNLHSKAIAYTHTFKTYDTHMSEASEGPPEENKSKGILGSDGRFDKRTILWGLAVACTMFLLRSQLLWWFVITVALSIGVFWQVAQQRVMLETKKAEKRRKFRFLSYDNWLQEVDSLRVDKKLLDQPHVEISPGISRCLSNLTDLILAEFVDSWFTKISPDTLFQDSIRAELKLVSSNLSSRLKELDVASVLVNKIVPKLTDHYARFTAISESYDGSYSIEDKLKIARAFAKGGIHKGVTLSVSGFEGKTQEKQNLRDLVKEMLTLLLSPGEKSNKLVLSLLTELLSCTVLANVFAVLSEGDFFNRMIVKVVGSNLEHRDQVKRLREALVEHTTHTQNDNNEKTPTDFTLKTPISANSTFLPGELTKGRENSHTALSQEISPLSAHQPNNSQISSISLENVLAESRYFTVFKEFLRASHQDDILDLWKDIEAMRAPLESTDSSEVPLLLEFSNADDICRIYEKYLATPHVKVDDLLISVIAEYARNGVSEDIALYQNARQALFELQRSIFQDMKSQQFVEFEKSQRFLDLTASSPRKAKPRVFSSTFKHGNEKSLKDVEAESIENSSVSPAVISAVESAFEKIMVTESKVPISGPPEKNTSSNHLSHKPSQASLFGDSGNLDASALRSHSNSMNRLSALFEGSHESDSDANSVLSELALETSEHNLSNSELLLAPPGDLSLAEKIDVLDNSIQNLSQQNEVLLSLLKKAELTNNVSELKILRRSYTSLEKEIEMKELQKQQYIVQENDNSLYGKSKVRIQSCVFGKDENLPYVMYVIEVQKYSSEDPNVIVAGWIVARRFSQFYKLHEYLKRRYAEVNQVKFPKKNVPYLKFQTSQQIETRKPQLEKYLQDLLALPEVCSSSAFRSFLSSEDFHIGKSSHKKPDSLFSQFNKSIGADPEPNNPTPRTQNEELLRNIKEMERELKQFDEVESSHTEKVPFVKPISDLLLTVFDMTSNWLRGRALLVILQQVLGATIERTITSQIEQNLRQEEKIIGVLAALETMLFPNGKFMQSPERRTKAEQLTTRKEAYTILRLFMSETCSKIFGPKSTHQACDNILEMVQNDYLNEHLMFEILDEVVAAIFPDM